MGTRVALGIGSPGPTGATGPPGISATWRGAYNAGTTYSAGPPPDGVLGSNGHWYVSLTSGNIGHDPTTDGGVHWADVVPPSVALLSSPNTFTAKQTVTVASGEAFVLSGGTPASGVPVARFVDAPTGKTLLNFENMSGSSSHYGGFIGIYGENGTGQTDATGAKQAWQIGLDGTGSIPSPYMDLAFSRPIVKTYTGIQATAGSTAIVATGGTTFDANRDPGFNIASTNIPSGITIASVQDSTHATLSSSAGVTSGTASATLNRDYDEVYIVNGGLTSDPCFRILGTGNSVTPIASMEIGGPYHNNNTPTQLALLTGNLGNLQTAPPFRLRHSVDTVDHFALAGNNDAQQWASPATYMLPGTLKFGPGSGTAPDTFIGRKTSASAITIANSPTSGGGVQEALNLYSTQASPLANDGQRIAFRESNSFAAAIDVTVLSVPIASGQTSFTFTTLVGGATATPVVIGGATNSGLLVTALTSGAAALIVNNGTLAGTIASFQSNGTAVTKVLASGQINYNAAALETTGSGSAALGANCPAVTATAPFKWWKVTTQDGSQGYIPVWK